MPQRQNFSIPNSPSAPDESKENQFDRLRNVSFAKVQPFADCLSIRHNSMLIRSPSKSDDGTSIRFCCDIFRFIPVLLVNFIAKWRLEVCRGNSGSRQWSGRRKSEKDRWHTAIAPPLVVRCLILGWNQCRTHSIPSRCCDDDRQEILRIIWVNVLNTFQLLSSTDKEETEVLTCEWSLIVDNASIEFQRRKNLIDSL